MNRLQEKICIITGAGSGIGRASAEMFGREGAVVVVTDIKAASAEEVAHGIVRAGGQAIALTVDVGEEDQLRRMIDTTMQKFGRIDVLFNNALMAVISHMLGVPARDRLKFRRLMNGTTTGSPRLGLLRILGGAHAMYRLMGFLESLLTLRRHEPDEGLITALVAAEQAGDSLSPDECLAMLFLLLFAGHETTVNLIGSGMLALIDNPEQLTSLIGQPTLAEPAVEELLRYTNPVQFGASRIALEDLKLGEVTIKKHDVVIALLSSANRDATIFQDPEGLNISRSPNRHLGFGLGIHFCLGAPLARMEGRIAFNKLLARFPNIRLAVLRAEIRWRASPVFRGLKSLPVYLE